MRYYPNPDLPIKNLLIESPSKKEKKILNLLIILGYAISIAFLIWYINYHEAGNPFLFYPFTFAILFIFSRLFFEWYNFLGISVPHKPVLKKQFTVDILTTFCPGEPYQMVETTLKAAKKITYPHKTIYLCDEADDARLKAFCQAEGIVHVTRKDKCNAKAGNINNALLQAKGELCVILDPDHIPIPEFLDRVLPYFEEEKVGYVQCCQGYYNQEESPIALGACEQTYHFYGPQMMGMGTYGTAQAIGANCTFRRTALDSIGGHSAGLTEDMHTSMNLQAKGWKAVYVPEMLSRGLVPADVVAYYKQQLKWSRGSFEMLFEKYPKLFSRFTWRQKLHHLMTPLFYLNGLASLIFLLLPIFSLFLSDVPVHIDFVQFMTYFIPVVGFQMLIRQYVQHWLYKPQERGFHLTGGILMVGTWWIYTLGFLYSIVRKKVPYLPTPKEGQKKNFFLLLLPNLLILFASLVAVVYGLSRDWSPFSWLMSTFAGLNVVLLLYFCCMCQQKWLMDIKSEFNRKRVLSLVGHQIQIATFRYSQLAFFSFRKYATLIALVVFALTLTNNIVKESNFEKLQEESIVKPLHYGGYWIGYSTCSDSACSSQSDIAGGFSTTLSEHAIALDISSEKLPITSSCSAIIKEADPTLIPILHISFFDPSNLSTLEILRKINLGLADHAFLHFLQILESANRTFYLNLLANDLTSNFSSEEESAFKSAWVRLASMLHNKGLSNNVLLFSVDSPKKLDMLYPGSQYVDWIALQVDAPERMEEYQASFLQMKKPVLLSMASADTRQLLGSLQALPWQKYCSGLLIHDRGQAGDNRALANYLTQVLPEANSIQAVHMLPPPSMESRSSCIAGQTGSFHFIENGQPFFVKGIAYNVAHDWRDQDKSLTRKALTKDFDRIKSLGANTIRRYGSSQYDLNILNVASEHELRVLYGFWLEPEVDYLKDSAQLKKYEDDILANVAKFKDHPAVLAWSIGNETWSLLKYHYGKPYLGLVRRAYVDYLERLSRKVKAIDPVHPVLTVIEYNDAYAVEELHQLKEFAPTLDLVGVNAYYEEQLRNVDGLMQEHYSGKPYLITEFGPRGYWHPSFSKFDKDNLLLEDHDAEKARLYEDQWNNYVLPHKGKLLGGMAYSWTDRLEGTFTWYGVTDFKERAKPSYYALQRMWTGKTDSLTLTKAKIQAEEELFYPGRKYVFEAQVNAQGDFEYEWYLKKDNYMGDVLKGIKPQDEGRSVEVTIPLDPSEYRLYLYVSDKEGRVVTASKGIKTDYSFMERLIP